MSADAASLTEQLCDRFLLAQQASGLPKGAFARAVGMTPSQLTNIAKYRNRPPHDAIEQAARLFGFTADWFYFGSMAGFRDPTMAARLRNLELG